MYFPRRIRVYAKYQKYSGFLAHPTLLVGEVELIAIDHLNFEHPCARCVKSESGQWIVVGVTGG